MTEQKSVFVAYFEQQDLEEKFVESVGEAYEELLNDNLGEHLDELPRDVREDMAERASEVYADQARRILDSGYLDESDVEVAAATAFLSGENVKELACATRAVLRQHQEEFNGDFERYERWSLRVLNDPWPPQDLGTGVERFKPGERDRTFY